MSPDRRACPCRSTEFDTSATYGWRDCGVSRYNTGEHRSMIARWVWRSAATGTRSWGCLASLANNAVHRTGARVAGFVRDRSLVSPLLNVCQGLR